MSKSGMTPRHGVLEREALKALLVERVIALANDCHNPAGPGGGQFCEGDDGPAPDYVGGQKYDRKVVRAWAQKNGIEVGSRGNMPKSVYEAYHKSLTITGAAVRFKGNEPRIASLENTLEYAKEAVDGHDAFWQSLSPAEQNAIDAYVGGKELEFGPLNADLRMYRGNFSKMKNGRAKETAKLMASALEKAPILTTPIIVYRGIKLASKDLIKLQELTMVERREIVPKLIEDMFTSQVGKVGTSYGFSSTSLDPAVGAWFADGKIRYQDVRRNAANYSERTRGGGSTNKGELGGYIIEMEVKQGAYVAPRGRNLAPKKLHMTNSEMGLEEQQEFLLPANNKYEVVEVVQGVPFKALRGSKKDREVPYTVIRVRQVV